MVCNYHNIKNNPEMLKKESQRISTYLNDKYKNDEQFREKKKEYQREYRRRLKSKQNEAPQNEV